MENETARKLMSAFFQFGKLKWKQGPTWGLKHSEMAMLFCVQKFVVREAQGIKVSELSNLLRVTAPSVTQLVNNLESQGYVVRNVDAQDRRSVRIKLTEKGEDVTRKASKALLATLNGLVEYLGEDSSRQLTELLGKVFLYFDSLKVPHEF